MSRVMSLLIFVLVLSLATSAFAWKSEIEGRPKQFSGGGPGFYIWQDEYGFHVWTIANGETHRFVGEIRTDGRLYQVRGHHLDAGEAFYRYPDIVTRFWFEPANSLEAQQFEFSGLEATYDPHKMTFRYNPTDGFDGIRFMLSGGTYISFNLLMDGRGVPADRIFIGKDGEHPDSNVFQIRQ